MIRDIQARSRYRVLGLGRWPTLILVIAIGAVGLLVGLYIYVELHASAVRRLNQEIKAAGGNTTGLSDFGIYIVFMGSSIPADKRHQLMMHLYRLKSPQSELQLSAKDVTAEEWTLIGEMAWLRRLDVSESNLDDHAMAHLAKLKNLETLRINDTRITGEGLSRLGEMPKLKSLYIERCPIDKDSLKIWSESHPKCFRYDVLLRMLTAPKPERTVPGKDDSLAMSNECGGWPGRCFERLGLQED